jgi:hypothetical protein
VFHRSLFGFCALALCSLFSCSRKEAGFSKARAEPIPASASPGDKTSSFALVELFTSEGCSSCPPADKNLGRITDRAERERARIFTLSFHVDYWNYLGWSDPFSARAFSERQQAHARALGASTYTPQMVVNGRVEFLGSDQGDADQAIESALARPASTRLVLEPKWNGESRELEVKWRVEPLVPDLRVSLAVVQSADGVRVTRGENRGETLSHRNVVRAFESLPAKTRDGVWTKKLAPEITPERAELIGFVEEESSLSVVAAERASLVH